MELDVLQNDASTEVGSYFVANYPPFSAWQAEHVPTAMRVLDSPSPEGVTAPLGLYLHIPFCRTRCKFCYFRVYTDKNGRDVDVYLDALAREVALLAEREVFAGRQFDFVYFGGGTPSFLSNQQLERLIDGIRRHWTWEAAREVTFECEPGTLKKSKLETIRAIGTTRLSLGVEHFDDNVLELNGRAHRSAEIRLAYDWAREVGFPQINIDLIAGMLGDDRSKWEATVAEAVAMAPDSVTIYQMEVPHNTLIAREAKQAGQAAPVIGWTAKREWVDYAFGRFEEVGYVVSSAYTLVHPDRNAGFIYRDALWHGGDMVGTGVASFSHVSGVHFQNVDQWEDYIERIHQGSLPLGRALPIDDRQRLIRELILQLKLGRIDGGYFRKKFDVEIGGEFSDAFHALGQQGFANIDGDRIELTREGLLRVDALLPVFFESRYRGVRYT